MSAGKRVKGESGEHPAVKTYRAKIQSISDNQLPEMQALNSRIDHLLTKIKSDFPPESVEEVEIDEEAIETPRVKRDLRREESSSETPSLPPTDFVRVPTVPREPPRPTPRKKP
mgnify:CR=1 FL=1